MFVVLLQDFDKMNSSHIYNYINFSITVPIKNLSSRRKVNVAGENYEVGSTSE